MFVVNFNPKATKARRVEAAPSELKDFEVVVTSAADLEKRSLGELVELYNVLRAKGEAEVRRFKDRENGARRCFEKLEQLNTAKTRSTGELTISANTRMFDLCNKIGVLLGTISVEQLAEDRLLIRGKSAQGHEITKEVRIVTAETKKGTKMEAATAIFEKMTAEGKSRKEIIEAMMEGVDISKAHASTYYQTIKTRLASAEG